MWSGRRSNYNQDWQGLRFKKCRLIAANPDYITQWGALSFSAETLTYPTGCAGCMLRNQAMEFRRVKFQTKHRTCIQRITVRHIPTGSNFQVRWNSSSIQGSMNSLVLFLLSIKEQAFFFIPWIICIVPLCLPLTRWKLWFLAIPLKKKIFVKKKPWY